MRYLLAAIFAIAFYLGIASPAATATMYRCFGTPPEYVQAFDGVRGQALDGTVAYPEKRWYDEEQTWATHAGLVPGHHSEHVHMGRCIPNNMTLTGTATRYMDVEYIFHNVQDYAINGGSSVYSPAGENAAQSRQLYHTDAAQAAEMQAAADTSGNGAVNRVFQSYPLTPPSWNGYKEARGGVSMVASGPDAVFPSWSLDARWYFTDNVPGLPAGPATNPDNTQIAVRNRSNVIFCKPDGDLSTCGQQIVDYHHSGWRGLNPPQALSAFVPSMGKGSAAWGRDQVWNAWSETQDTTVGLYVTDGGGPAALMIDPDFHNHYDAPTASCPNVDAAGNCLGKWFWKPANARQELFSAPGVSVWPNVTIPASVIASLSPGLHKLVFMTSDLGDCARQGRPCPIDMRGIWTNVHVLPFQVN